MIGTYNPTPEVANLLDQAYDYVRSVPYSVTARWVFYRLLQDGYLDKKADYKRLLGFLSKARKGFYKSWTPWTLADDTREAILRGDGPTFPQDWVELMADTVTCELNRWTHQPNYVEVWFEASAMASQFEFYTNENITLLAFHGDISIPEKWKSAVRLYSCWKELQVPIRVLYYGDLDPKGLQIPRSALVDVLDFILAIARSEEEASRYDSFERYFKFIRVGINEDHPALYNIPENPERPGTYQWEALDDLAARELIEQADKYLDPDGFEVVRDTEQKVTEAFQEVMDELAEDVKEW